MPRVIDGNVYLDCMCILFRDGKVKDCLKHKVVKSGKGIKGQEGQALQPVQADIRDGQQGNEIPF